eukprot:2765317-Pyramimonas_sp.AAC.1
MCDAEQLRNIARRAIGRTRAGNEIAAGACSLDPPGLLGAAWSAIPRDVKIAIVLVGGQRSQTRRR